MIIRIKSSGAATDDNLVHFQLQVENDDYKGTATYYEYPPTFQEFSQKLLLFPFGSTKEVYYSADGVMITISLTDPAGRINMSVSFRDGDSNQATFTDQTLNIEPLHRLAKRLASTDFSIGQTIEWDSTVR
jgi:hypothetical protein